MIPLYESSTVHTIAKGWKLDNFLEIFSHFATTGNRWLNLLSRETTLIMMMITSSTDYYY